MGWFDVTFVLLKEKQVPLSFLLDLHKKFSTIHLALEIDDDEFIVFNDTQNGSEKENIDLNNAMLHEEVIRLLCDWQGLGLLSYRHPAFNFPITLNYLTWDDTFLGGFTIGFNGHEVSAKQNKKEQLIKAIISLVDYQFAIGDIGDIYIGSGENLSEILRYIENQKFEIDLRSD